MDIVELLLLAAFVGFPLLQLLLEKLTGGRKPPPPPEGMEELPPLPPASPEATLPSPVEQGWSREWGSWPTEAFEELAAEEVVSEEKADELIALQEHFAQREIPEAARVTMPVVSLEALQVDRSAEHARLHATPLSRPELARRGAAPAIGSALRTSEDLRRAFVLAEILGKPKGLT